MTRSSRPSTSRANRGSQYEPQMSLMTFQPAPRKSASSSWMILPLPRTGPSRRCRLQFTTKSQDLGFGEPTLQECARVDAGRRVSLEVDEIPPVSFVWRVPEVIEADAEQRSDRGEARDVTAQLVVRLVGLCHHHHRIP